MVLIIDPDFEVIILYAFTCFPVCTVSGGRLPMALWQFGEMITCVQPGVNPLAYNEYGCWCGLGGSGTPVDDVDR